VGGGHPLDGQVLTDLGAILPPHVATGSAAAAEPAAAAAVAAFARAPEAARPPARLRAGAAPVALL